MHDYVIVGAGSAGCVLANRLSEDPSVSVLLLEAGGKDRSMKIKIPAAFPQQFHTKLDWDFSTEPEPHVDGRSLYVPRGKALGGSSSMNAMLYVRGRPLDYDGWAAQGAPGWGYADVLPYFIRSEDNARGASEFHGVGGPLRVSEQRSPRPMDRRLLAASEAAGIPLIADYNGPEQDGASMFQVTQSNGARFSAADAYLKPVMSRPNLEVRTNVTVLGVELEGDRAVGVRIRRGRGCGRGRARRPRGPAQRRRDRLAAAAAAVRDRGRGRAGRRRRAPPPRAARRRAQPPGPSLRHDDVGGHRPADPLRRRQAEAARRVAAAKVRPAELDGRGGRRLHPHPRRAAGRGHPVPHGRRLLRRPRRGDLRRPLHGDRAGARVAEGAGPGVAALIGSDRQAEDPHQHAVRARGPRFDDRRNAARPQDRRPGPAQRGQDQGAAGPGRRHRTARSSKRTCAGA